MPEGTDDPRLTAEGELAMARLALDEADLDHAARHVANAFAADPTLPEAHEALSRLSVAAEGRVLDLFPLDEPVYLGTVVARAHLLAATGRFDQAITLLVSATHFDSTKPWASVAWLEDGATARRVPADVLAGQLIQVAAVLDDPVDEDDRAAVTAYLTLARHAVAAHPDAADLRGAASAVARRLGAVDEAIAWARRATELEPSMLTWMWLGYAHRSAGQVDESVAAWKRALEWDPHNCALHTDIAEVLAGAGRGSEAMDWVERALAIDPRDGSAFPTACLLRFHRDGEYRHLLELADYLREEPSNEHASRMLAEGCRSQDWLGGVPPAADAVSNVLQQMLAAGEDPADAGLLTLNGAAPPSSLATFQRSMPNAVVEIHTLPGPDPRRPRRPDGLVLWAYDGTNAHPAVPAPSAKAITAITDLAHPRWPHPLAAYDQAIQLAGLALNDLVGLLAYPPSEPDTELGRALARHEPGLWVRSVQAWACLGLLHHHADEAWEDSTRRRTLASIAFGIEDWAAEAAVGALVTAAWVDPRVRADVAGLVADRLRDAVQVNRRREVAIRWSLARLALVTPGIEPDAERIARTILDEDLDDEDGGVAEHRPRALASGDDDGQASRPGLLRRLVRRFRR